MFEVDTDHAFDNCLGVLLARHQRDCPSGSPKEMGAVQRWGNAMTSQLDRQLATDVYKLKDGQWYSIHWNMNSAPARDIERSSAHCAINLSH